MQSKSVYVKHDQAEVLVCPTIMMIFPIDQEFARQLWTCPGCTDDQTGAEVVGSRDTQQQVLACSGYAQLREDKDLSKDTDLVRYFAQVIKIRLEEV